jgi:hypothetical protein
VEQPQPAVLRIEAPREHQARYDPRKPPEGPELLRVGDLVYVRNHEVSKVANKCNAGLVLRWIDPCKIAARLGPETYLVRRPGRGLVKYHLSKIKLHTAPGEERDVDRGRAPTDDTMSDSRDSPLTEHDAPFTT